MEKKMKYILAPYKDPAFGLDWDEQTPIIKKEIHNRLMEYTDAMEYEILETNHGKGADWPTIALIIINSFFIIPSFHKKIRESISEWKLISNNVSSLTKWISDKFRILFYPKEILFLESLAEIEKVTDVNEIELISIDESDKIYEGMLCPESLKLITFTFKKENMIYQVGLNSERKLMYVNKIKTIA